MDKLKKFKSSSIFLPLVALAILVIFNIIFVPGFLDVEITQMVDYMVVCLIF